LADIAVGVIASHDDYPIERLALDHSGKWLGSVSHDLCIKLTDVEGLLEDDGEEDDEEMDSDDEGEAGGAAEGEAADAAEDEDDDDEAEDGDDSDEEMTEAEAAAPAEDWGSDSDVEMDKPKKNRGPMIKASKDQSMKDKPDGGFFDDL
jgi:hypothetical protein